MRLSILAAVAAVATADQCRFNASFDPCPAEGQACTQAKLCTTGFYCKIDALGQNGAYTGRCSKGPAIEGVYRQPCDFSTSFKTCQFDNPLAMSPRTPNVLRCTSTTDGPGLCLLGPQKHGDGCNDEAECASGNCVKALKMCQGVEEGEECAPGYPDPCKPGTYCAAMSGSSRGGRCSKVVSKGRKCIEAASCERGAFCAGPTFEEQTCREMFSVDDKLNITSGPYMCISANAIMVQQPPATPIFQCIASDGPTSPATKIGIACDSNAATPMGFECKCARSNYNELRPINGLGLSARAQIWKDLYKCLIKSTDIMGKPCAFDVGDMETMRYGSCGFYSCYPYYLKLVEATGSRMFKDPLLRFEAAALCEVEAATKYYERLMSTPCIQIPNLESWKCSSLAGYSSLSVQDTSGVIAFIFMVVWGGYLYHMWRFRKENGVTFPCARLN